MGVCCCIMFEFRFSLAVLALLLVSSAWAEELSEEENVVEDLSEMSVGELLERANKDRTFSLGEPALMEGDIAVDSEAERNADPCTSRGCLWSKNSDKKVYVPVSIHSTFSSREKEIIQRGLDSFSGFSCISFRPYRSGDRDYLS